MNYDIVEWQRGRTRLKYGIVERTRTKYNGLPTNQTAGYSVFQVVDFGEKGGNSREYGFTCETSVYWVFGYYAGSYFYFISYLRSGVKEATRD